MASFWEYPAFCSRCVVDADDDDPASLPLAARAITTGGVEEEEKDAGEGRETPAPL